ncbi:class I mannose-6-phosphate isomerase [Edaphobacter bradus]|uniref:class I mannose-6-phosphate isomerase n=1 Tax=Edaphobacter bradus TaxID=2259016 RepID=UPI0021DF5F09|nr:class I mannose-6-phosphate isomerase [Edaphobacter bradus]
MLAPHLGDDRVFGRMNGLTIEDWFDPKELIRMREDVIAAAKRGTVFVIGSGAALLAPECDALVYADMARWEIQLRYRRFEMGNLGCDNKEASFAEKYKCGFFAEWRAADRLKKHLLPVVDFLLDTNDARAPKMICGDTFRKALAHVARRPFRVVPYFDPGPWGGHWMEEVCDLPKDSPNHAWCFDCVPEENSLLLGYGKQRIEVPAVDLVFAHPRELLGDAVHARFGTEFPIRFDFLDTMGGGNLSLQVHPLTEFIQDRFGMHYTQDESYYLLDAAPGAVVYLGLKEGIDRAKMSRDLHAAQTEGGEFPTDEYVNQFPAQPHDHFLIPAGTIHCSGKDSMVLEISATPYIFTFKLWDWGRLGLDGQPRPIHIEHGLANIQWDRTTAWTRKNLVNSVEPVAAGDGWREEVTGLHEREFIETRRHWFTGTVPHNTHGGVNVLNLVQGEEALVESPSGAFEPYVVHYAETFIVPAAVGEFTIRPHGAAIGTECATIKAFVRTEPGA